MGLGRTVLVQLTASIDRDELITRAAEDSSTSSHSCTVS